MTFFLREKTSTGVANPLPFEVSSYFEGLGAGATKAMIEADANFKSRRTRIAVEGDRARSAMDRLGYDRVRQVLEDRNRKATEAGSPSQVRPIPETMDGLVEQYGANFANHILKIARDEAKLSPDLWADLDLSPEGIEKETNERLQAEHDDAQKTLDMMPGGAGAAELLGGLAGSLADVRNVPWLLAGGGGGSFVRIMGREAALNMGAEASQFDSRVDMADRLEIPEPSFAGTMAEAAVAGAVLGGGIEAIARGIRYYRGRNVTSEISGFDRDTSDLVVGAVEAAIERGENPGPALVRAYDEVAPIHAERDFLTALDEAKRALPADAPLAGRIGEPWLDTAPKTATRLPADQIDLPRLDVEPQMAKGIQYSDARARDPEAFQILEDSQRRIGELRADLDSAVQAQTADREAILSHLTGKEAETRAAMDALRTGGRRKHREQIKEIGRARAEAEASLTPAQTPEMLAKRQAIIEQEARIRDVAQRVSGAYRSVREERAGLPEIRLRQRKQGQPQASSRPLADVPPSTGASLRQVETVAGPEASAAGATKLFSDPTSKEARVVLDSIGDDLRTKAVDDDFRVSMDLPDGSSREMSATEILDWLDEGDRAAARLELCGMMGAGA